ncbi:MAG TPA: hypothetical protein VHP35_02010, partial [Terriglobia bacterium]|nr:hypothetical protein [Terriglobia bacterium]
LEGSETDRTDTLAGISLAGECSDQVGERHEQQGEILNWGSKRLWKFHGVVHVRERGERIGSENFYATITSRETALRKDRLA